MSVLFTASFTKGLVTHSLTFCQMSIYFVKGFCFSVANDLVQQVIKNKKNLQAGTF